MALMLLALGAFTFSSPAAASERWYFTGTADQQIDLLEHCGGTWTYAANSPFWVAHGYFLPGWSSYTPEEKQAEMLPTTYFELEIDGVMQHSAMIALYIPQADLKVKIFPSGYDQGLPAGEHTFVGTWYEDGALVGGTPGTAVPVDACTVTVTFT